MAAPSPRPESKSKCPGACHQRLVLAVLEWLDSTPLGEASVNEIAKGIHRSPASVRSVIGGPEFYSRQKLGRDYGERWPWRMVYGRRRIPEKPWREHWKSRENVERTHR